MEAQILLLNAIYLATIAVLVIVLIWCMFALTRTEYKSTTLEPCVVMMTQKGPIGVDTATAAHILRRCFVMLQKKRTFDREYLVNTACEIFTHFQYRSNIELRRDYAIIPAPAGQPDLTAVLDATMPCPQDCEQSCFDGPGDAIEKLQVLEDKINQRMVTRDTTGQHELTKVEELMGAIETCISLLQQGRGIGHTIDLRPVEELLGEAAIGNYVFAQQRPQKIRASFPQLRTLPIPDEQQEEQRTRDNSNGRF